MQRKLLKGAFLLLLCICLCTGCENPVSGIKGAIEGDATETATSGAGTDIGTSGGTSNFNSQITEVTSSLDNFVPDSSSWVQTLSDILFWFKPVAPVIIVVCILICVLVRSVVKDSVKIRKSAIIGCVTICILTIAIVYGLAIYLHLVAG